MILEGPSKEQERTHSNKAVSAVALHEAVRRGIVLCLDITLLVAHTALTTTW